MLKDAIIIWIGCALFIDSVPAAPTGSKAKVYIQNFLLKLSGPIGLIRTAIVRLKALKK